MLNRAARFFPILRELKSRLADGSTLLEVGSGSLGLGEFWNGTFVGCDLSFASTPVSNMRAVQCSAAALPFGNASFDAVVVSDVMEHIRPELRKQVIAEVLRVAREIVIFGYPCGPAAFEVDNKLYGDYRSHKLPAPEWLKEHMLYPFPAEDLFVDLPNAWRKRVLPNESLGFHYWVMTMEMSQLFNFAMRVILKTTPGLAERCLQRANREPSYRKIFVLTAESVNPHA